MGRSILPEPKRDLAALLLLLFVGVCFFVRVLFLADSLYLRDLTRYYYPTKRIIREVILSGEIPYWNRYYSAGQPMAANPEYEIFYPPQWLVLLPSYNFGYRLHIFVHVLIALAGMYLLLRSLRLQIRSSLVGALAFGVGGLPLSLVNLLPILFAAVWIPWILLFARRCLQSPNWRDFSLAALLLGLQALVGEPTTLVQTYFLLAMYALYRGWHHPPRAGSVLRNLLLCFAMIAAGVAVGAVQIAPAADHVVDSARSRAFDFGLVTTWSMPFAKPLELIFPNAFGHLSMHNVSWLWGSGMYRGTGSGFYYNIYSGILLIALAMAAFAIRPRGGRFTLIVTGVSSLLALGGHTPLFRILYDAGLARTIRYPEKFALMGLFVLIVFASAMLDRILDGDRRLARMAILILLVSAGAAAAASIFSFTPWMTAAFTSLWGKRPTVETAHMVGLYRVDWIVATVRGVAFASLLWWALRRGAGRSWYAVLFLAFTLDLWLVCSELIPTFPRRFFTPPTVASSLDSDKSSYRIFHEADWYGGSAIAKKYFSTGDAVYWIVRNGLYPMTGASWGFQTVLERDYDRTALLPTVDFVHAMWKVRDSGRKDWAEAFMAMSNGRYRASFLPFEEEKKRVGGKFRNAAPVRFEKVSEENPRYYFADQIVRTKDLEGFIDRMAKGGLSRRVAFIESAPFVPSPGRVVSVEERNNSAVLDVRSEGKGLLVMSVTRHKYWKATLDGRPAPLQGVNIAYQGIVVPPGTHRVVMRYSNPVVKGAGALSVASGLVLLVIAFRSRAGERPETKTHADHVEQHSQRIADDAYLRLRRVDPSDGNLGDGESET